MSWIQQNRDIDNEECSAIRQRLPDVEINTDSGLLVAKGPFPIFKEGVIIRRYILALVFPKNYPEWVPTVFMLEPHVKYIPDRHIFNNGGACLCLPHEVMQHLPNGIRFADFLDRLLAPWLIGQASYDKHGKWPLPARAHNREGILEGFSDLLDIKEPEVVERYARLLVRKNPAKGHEPCPCGSELKLRDCHKDLYYRCRDKIPSRVQEMYRKWF
jgi:hypothetical protein